MKPSEEAQVMVDHCAAVACLREVRSDFFDLLSLDCYWRSCKKKDRLTSCSGSRSTWKTDLMLSSMDSGLIELSNYFKQSSSSDSIDSGSFPDGLLASVLGVWALSARVTFSPFISHAYMGVVKSIFALPTRVGVVASESLSRGAPPTDCCESYKLNLLAVSYLEPINSCVFEAYCL